MPLRVQTSDDISADLFREASSAFKVSDRLATAMRLRSQKVSSDFSVLALNEASYCIWSKTIRGDHSVTWPVDVANCLRKGNHVEWMAASVAPPTHMYTHRMSPCKVTFLMCPMHGLLCKKDSKADFTSRAASCLFRHTFRPWHPCLPSQSNSMNKTRGKCLLPVRGWVAFER